MKTITITSSSLYNLDKKELDMIKEGLRLNKIEVLKHGKFKATFSEPPPKERKESYQKAIAEIT